MLRKSVLRQPLKVGSVQATNGRKWVVGHGGALSRESLRKRRDRQEGRRKEWVEVWSLDVPAGMVQFRSKEVFL